VRGHVQIYCTEMLFDFVDKCMQRSRVHGVMVDDTFNPRAFMDDVLVDSSRGMEGIDSPGNSGRRQVARTRRPRRRPARLRTKVITYASRSGRGSGHH
jgi:hypothetical protein